MAHTNRDNRVWGDGGPKQMRECYALDCKEPIPRNRLMCLKHWHMVPIGIRDQVVQTWHAAGANGSLRPYLIAITKAKLHVAVAEHCSRETADQLEAQVKEFEKGKR
jgi:hypothetical protein